MNTVSGRSMQQPGVGTGVPISGLLVVVQKVGPAVLVGGGAIVCPPAFSTS